MAVTSDDYNHIFHVWVTDSIPWQYYVGRADQERYSIYNGDNPKQAYKAREKANDKIKKSL